MGCSKVLQRAFVTITLAVTTVVLSAAAQDRSQATFRSSADVVSMAVIVRDGAGRLVTGLTAQDFEVMDRGIVHGPSSKSTPPMTRMRGSRCSWTAAAACRLAPSPNAPASPPSI